MKYAIIAISLGLLAAAAPLLRDGQYDLETNVVGDATTTSRHVLDNCVNTKRDGATGLDADCVLLKPRDGATEADPDIVLLKPRDGATEADPDFVLLKPRDGATDLDPDTVLLKSKRDSTT